MKFQATIFDMDGLLIDSEIHWGVVEDDIWGKLGMEPSEALNREILGLNMTDTCIVIHKYRPDISVEKIRAVFNAGAQIVYKLAEFMPGASELLSALKQEAGTKIALVSSSSQSWVNQFLDKFNLQHFFDLVLSTEGMSIPGKPAPDAYIESMKRLGVAPTQSIIFEDTTRGLTAAKGSGAFTVAVPDPRWSFGDFSSADLVVSSLRDKKVYEALGLEFSPK